MKRWNGKQTQQEAAHGANPAPPPRRSWLFRGGTPAHTSLVTLAGRAADVTEDEVGVVELHLGQYDGAPYDGSS